MGAAATADEDDAVLLLRKHLSRFDSVSKVKALAEKLFQKEPQLFKDLEEHLTQRVPSGSKTYLLHESRAFVTRIILRAIKDDDDDEDAQGENRPKLPKNLEAYLAYMDLCWMGATQKTPWHTFKLQGFQSAPLSSLSLFSFRRRFKELLPASDHVFSVQTDINSDEPEEDASDSGSDPRILFRVVLQKCSRKARRKDKKLLLRKTPTFFVYYPGEPYLYADKPALDPIIDKAICECFLATSCHPIPLTGTHLESLRQFRLLRDGKLFKSPDERPPPSDVLDLMPGDDCNLQDATKNRRNSLPRIQELRITCEEPFLGKEELSKANLHRKRPILVTDLHFEVRFQGPDVLAGLQKITSLTSSSSPTNPTFAEPDILPLVLKRGRNKFSLKRRRRNEDGGNLEVTDSILEEDDQMSTVESEMTLT